MAALAEFDREPIVEGTLEGLAAARARGRVGGRPPGLTQLQLDQAQLMYDAGQHTAEEIAATFGVARGTLYRHLAAYKDGRDCVRGRPRSRRRSPPMGRPDRCLRAGLCRRVLGSLDLLVARAMIEAAPRARRLGPSAPFGTTGRRTRESCRGRAGGGRRRGC